MVAPEVRMKIEIKRAFNDEDGTAEYRMYVWEHEPGAIDGNPRYYAGEFKQILGRGRRPHWEIAPYQNAANGWLTSPRDAVAQLLLQYVEWQRGEVDAPLELLTRKSKLHSGAHSLRPDAIKKQVAWLRSLGMEPNYPEGFERELLSGNMQAANSK